MANTKCKQMRIDIANTQHKHIVNATMLHMLHMLLKNGPNPAVYDHLSCKARGNWHVRSGLSSQSICKDDKGGAPEVRDTSNAALSGRRRESEGRGLRFLPTFRLRAKYVRLYLSPAGLKAHCRNHKDFVSGAKASRCCLRDSSRACDAASHCSNKQTNTVVHHTSRYLVPLRFHS